MRLQTGASALAFAAAASATSLGDVVPFPIESYSYCNVTLTYTHPGKGDTVVVQYALPEPSDYKKRFYVAGGGGYSLSATSTGGLEYGAVGGATSAGYGALDGTSYDDVVLYGNGSINWDATYMFGYQALGEMTKLGKYFTKGFYGQSSSSKLYTYYEGCSDGGREGMSQIQRYGDEYDGAITGAPAFRYGQQQVNHLFSNAVEHTLDHYPCPCSLSKIVNETIKACDPLDGRTDGVISRSDLCLLNFNMSSIIGEKYYCAAETSTSLGFGFSKRAEGSTTSYQPAQSGAVTAEDVAVAQTIVNGLHNSKGERAYVSYQIGAEFTDPETEWNNNTKAWELDIASTGGEFVTKFVQFLDLDNLSSLDGVTYDTLSGGKLIHYHGESDPSIPTASSIHYWQSVRDIMYPGMSSSKSLAKLQDWYQLYLIPGAAHCGTNDLQPGPYPEDNMEIMINWVENGVKPSRLNTTVTAGLYEGETQMLCQFPSRPLWKNNSNFDCVFDKASYESWTYEFPAFKVPVY
ncbi:Tannase/feruloyl esterase [Penicillium sp. IBT 16267x]|nr:Tannase/feruloyl esterase [Penicillium sp. IBT 16267x]